jgi:hypothetical protein
LLLCSNAQTSARGESNLRLQAAALTNECAYK